MTRSVEFDFGYGIGAVIAIAPVDGQYLPTDRKVPLKNVNYLVFHGSHDGDVTSFHGLRQFNRITYDTDESLFKSAIYVYRANHGQWNEVWGPKDNGPRSQRILDIESLIPEEDQRQFGKVYVSAFLDATLKGETDLLPIFRDHRRAASWLPKTMYFNQFQESSFQPIADFEGDIDVTTGSRDGVTLQGDSLSNWSEGVLELRSRNRANTSASQENQALWLAWNNRVRGQDELGPPATFRFTLSAEAVRGLGVGPTSSLDFMLSPTDDEPGPRKPPESDTNDSADEEPSGGDGPRDSDEGDAEEEKPPVDFSIVAVDAGGDRAVVTASDYGVLRRPLSIQVLRRRDLEEARFQNPWELVLQSFSVPMSDFVAANGDFNPERIRTVEFVFDKTEAGTVAVDNVGFSKMPSGFWR